MEFLDTINKLKEGANCPQNIDPKEWAIAWEKIQELAEVCGGCYFLFKDKLTDELEHFMTAQQLEKGADKLTAQELGEILGTHGGELSFVWSSDLIAERYGLDPERVHLDEYDTEQEFAEYGAALGAALVSLKEREYWLEREVCVSLTIGGRFIEDKKADEHFLNLGDFEDAEDLFEWIEERCHEIGADYDEDKVELEAFYIFPESDILDSQDNPTNTAREFCELIYDSEILDDTDKFNIMAGMCEEIFAGGVAEWLSREARSGWADEIEIDDSTNWGDLGERAFEEYCESRQVNFEELFDDCWRYINIDYEEFGKWWFTDRIYESKYGFIEFMDAYY